MQDIAGRIIHWSPGRDGRDGAVGPVIRVVGANGSADDTDMGASAAAAAGPPPQGFPVGGALPAAQPPAVIGQPSDGRAALIREMQGMFTEMSRQQLEAIANIGKANPDLQSVSVEDLMKEITRRTRA